MQYLCTFRSATYERTVEQAYSNRYTLVNRLSRGFKTQEVGHITFGCLFTTREDTAWCQTKDEDDDDDDDVQTEPVDAKIEDAVLQYRGSKGRAPTWNCLLLHYVLCE
jgi:hypothetical protein